LERTTQFDVQFGRARERGIIERTVVSQLLIRFLFSGIQRYVCESS
jgi:hypothetical protein